ncbi:MAG: tyrosine-type recombinase/integrase [Pseudonocardia sp.]|nr:tyrosine-type recombinase/integrase [Pseudonocardia sp.]
MIQSCGSVGGLAEQGGARGADSAATSPPSPAPTPSPSAPCAKPDATTNADLRRSWYPLREAAGLGDVVFHGLRHTWVTPLLDQGAPPHIVRDIVGHSAIEVTMTIYAHASLDEKRQALR